MGTGIYGQYRKANGLLDFLTIPGISQPETVIEYLAAVPCSVNLSLMRDKGVVWWKNGNVLSLKKCTNHIRGSLRVDERIWKKIKNLEAQPEFIKSVHQMYSKVKIDNSDYDSLLKSRSGISQGRSLTFSAKTASRLQIGGIENVLETRLLLHRLFGFPYIPGSALKGLALAALFHQHKLTGKPIVGKDGKLIPLNSTRLNQLCKRKKNAFSKEVLTEIGEIFGAPAIPERGLKERAGKIVFMDAWPESLDDLLDLDSWTVHYPEYYNEKNSTRLPGDDDKPNPLLQLCVKKGATFRFTLLADKKEDPDLLRKAKNYLQMGLEHLSIGAKPDYGYFSNFTNI